MTNVTLLDESKKKNNYGYLYKYLFRYYQRLTNRQQRILFITMITRKDWLKTDKGKEYKAKTNKNYRQKKKQSKLDHIKSNKSFEFHFPCGITLKE